MIEPKEPVTIHVRHAPTPAFSLLRDEDIKLTPSTIILRHRHFLKQFNVISGPSVVGDAEDAPKRKPTRGLAVAFATNPTDQRQPDPDQGLDLLEPRPADRIRAATTRITSRTVGSSLPQGGEIAVPPISVTTSVQVQPTRPPSKDPCNVNAGGNAASSKPVTQAGADGEVMTPANIGPPDAVLVVTQHSHSIRDRTERTVWFSSKSSDLLASPMTRSGTTLQDGHLYVHTASGERRQVWMWEKGKWNVVEMYHPHPHLTGYVLNLLSNGKPSWVTLETIRTYQGRAKKRERERTLR